MANNEGKLTLDIPFSLYSRYRSLSEVIERFRQKKEKLTILEVGGKGSYIRIFLPDDKMTLLDIQDSDEPDYIKGDGRNIPFDDKSFDVVVSTDVLEHLPQKDREKFIKEHLRVAKKGVVISAPFDSPQIRQLEAQANELYKQNANADHPWLAEHIKYQLPSALELEKIFKRQKVFFIKKHNQRLSLWSILVKVDLLSAANFTLKVKSSLAKLNRFYNQHIYRYDQSPPSYRTIYAASFSKLRPIKTQKTKTPADIAEKLLSLANNVLIDIGGHRQDILKEKDAYINKLIISKRKKIKEKDAYINKLIISKRKKINKLIQQNDLIQKEISVAKSQLKNYQQHIYEVEKSKIWKLFRFTTKTADKFIINPVSNTAKAIRQPKQLLNNSLVFLIKRRHNIPDLNLQYSGWMEKNKLTPGLMNRYKKAVSQLKYKPLISVITPLYKTPPELLDRLVASVKSQIYSNWELILVDDGSLKKELTDHLNRLKNDPKIIIKQNIKNKGIVGATNEAIRLSKGEFITLLDHDDELSPDALYFAADALNRNPKLDLIYSDEDKLDLQGRRCDPYFKPDWSPFLLLSQMYIPHLAVYRKSIGDKLGWMRRGYDGSQDYDLALRFTEKTENICHIPKILYHWRKVKGSTALSPNEKSYTGKVSLKAIESAIKRRKISASVKMGIQPETFKVDYKMKTEPLVSIIIPTKDRAKLLSKCIDSIIARTRYPNYEIVVLDNNSQLQETLNYFNVASKQSKIRVIKYSKPFNFSAINNFGASQAKGKYFLFLNNDTEVISRDWIREMLSLAQLKTVGAVGAKLLYPNNTIQHAGVVLGIGKVAGHSHKYLPDSFPGYFSLKDIVREYSAVTAGCLMIEKRKFNLVRGFDESFKVAFNDIDFCLRLRQKGFANLYTPYAKLFHHESVSVGRMEKGERDKALLQKELDRMQKKWGKFLKSDPYYNPNLSKTSENFGLNV